MSMTEAEWLTCTDPDRMLEQLLGGAKSGGLLAILGLARGRGRGWHYRISERKLRLFATTCCSRIWPLLRDGRSRDAVRTSAAYADGRAGDEELRAAREAAWAAARANTPGVFAEYVSVAGGAGTATGKGEFWGSRAAAEVASPDIGQVVRSVSEVERAAIQAATESRSAESWAAVIGAAVRADLLRDIFGNPFRPPPPLPRAVLAWNDGTVRRIAQAIYQERRMPEGALDTGRLAILADALLDAGCDDEELIQHCRSAGPHVRGCWAVDAILGKL
jgi:hypothetical protein